MRRIDLVGGFASFRRPRGPSSEKKVSGSASRFLRELESAEAKSDAGAVRSVQDGSIGSDPLEDLLDELHDAGDSLRSSSTYERIKRYKSAVKSFVAYVVSRTLKVEEKTSLGRINKRKKYTLVSVIDEKLESLAKDVVRNQSDQMEIVRRVDEINGLIVDLLQ